MHYSCCQRVKIFLIRSRMKNPKSIVAVVACLVVLLWLMKLSLTRPDKFIDDPNLSIPENRDRFALETRQFSQKALDFMKKFDLDCSRDYAASETTFVSAVSQNHYEESQRLFTSFQLRFPQSNLLLYDLGLDERYRRKLREKYSFLQIKIFDFAQYPSHVRKLKNYSWKPLIIAEILSTKRSDVLWMDTSVEWKSLKSVKNQVGELRFECHPSRPQESPLCHGFPLKLFDPTGHSIISATHPDIYRFFLEESEDEVDLTDKQMFSANLIFIRRRPETIRKIIYWWVLCALELHCIAPFNAKLKCESAETSKDVYRKCHRYDQSVLNILLTKANHLNTTAYTVPNTFAAIKRGFVPK